MTNPSQRAQSPASSLDSRLASYGAMAVAVAAGAASPAQAAVIVNNNPDVSISYGEFLYFNVVTGQTFVTPLSNNSNLIGAQFRLEGFSSSSFSTEGVEIQTRSSSTSAAGNGMLAFRLNTGDAIPGLNAFSTDDQVLAFRSFSSSAGFVSFGQWLNPGGSRRGFAALSFIFNGNRHYGWADISVDDSTGDFVATLHCLAYESDANTSLTAGPACGPDTAAVPEPSSAALLAFGAAGLLAYRRRKAA